MRSFRLLSAVSALALACASPGPEGLRPADEGPGPRVLFDVFHRPLPEVPLPNDFATRYDGSSPTHLRINASIEAAPTTWEKRTRAELDGVGGWGTLAPITVSFDAPLDVQDIARRHRAPADIEDDALYVLDVTESSPEFCQPVLLDLGQGHFPTVLDRREYYPDDPHAAAAEQLVFEQTEEDLDGDGELDPGEDTDMDGVLDHPNVLDATAGRFDVMSFYERETNTLIARPLYPMREATKYAVVLTSRLRGTDGQPVRSPFEAINHSYQTKALSTLPRCLAGLGLGLEDVAFTWSFTTQSVTSEYRAVRDGLYGRGTLAHLGTDYPVGPAAIEDARRRSSRTMNEKILPGDTFLAFGAQLFELYGGSQSQGTKQVFEDALKFVDFYASWSFNSPQLFPRFDAEGKQLPLYDQVWKLNAQRGEAFTRPEQVSTFMAVPKNRSGPAPVVIFVHGHSGSKLDSLLVMGPFARMGLATIGMDAVSHGVGLGELEQQLVAELVKPYNMDPLVKAILKGRALDQNGDGVVDSGSDYWTSYILHTRDVVRQTVLDILQLVRTLRSFDGVRTWDFDVNHDDKPDLAGDFDGDGKVDLGGPDAPIYLSGASLGGILSALTGGIEPEVDAMVPILPGGYLSEIGTRSDLGQVRDAMVLRMMAPLMLVHEDSSGQPALFQMVPDLVKSKELKVASLPAKLKPGAIAVLRNLKTGEWRCGRVQPNGHLRVAVSSDQGDPLTLEVFERELPSRPREGCEPPRTGAANLRVDRLEGEVKFQGRTYEAGSRLVAFGDGFGMRRGSPDLRRMMGLAQVALEQADPANFAPFYEGTRTFVHGDGSQVGTRALLVPMTGDPGVPIAAGVALARAAGFVNFRDVDPRYGKTQQQVLIDTGFVEGAERTGRWFDPNGKPVLMDVDVLQAVASADDGMGVPRLSPPLRLLRESPTLGGTVGVLFPHMKATGDHSFPVPDPGKAFDLGSLLINIFGTYLSSGGTRVPLEPCMERTSCDWIPRPPP